MTGLELVRSGLQRLGVLSAGQDPSGEDAEDGLRIANAFLSGLALQPLAMYRRLRTVKTLAADTATYTIGTGASIDVARPYVIEYARLILNTADADQLEVPIAVYSDQEWANIAQKTLSGGYIHGIWDDGNVDASGYGTLHLWPVPDTGTTQLVLYTRNHIEQLTLAGEVMLPDGWARMLEYNFACEFADVWDRPLNPRTQGVARDTLNRIKGVNTRPTRIRMPAGMPGMRHGRSDIRAGG